MKETLGTPLSSSYFELIQRPGGCLTVVSLYPIKKSGWSGLLEIFKKCRWQRSKIKSLRVGIHNKARLSVYEKSGKIILVALFWIFSK